MNLQRMEALFVITLLCGPFQPKTVQGYEALPLRSAVNATSLGLRQVIRAEKLGIGKRIGGQICHFHRYWGLIRMHFPDVATVVDVGANKGLVSSHIISLWRPDLRVLPEKLVPHFKAYFAEHNISTNPCGPCTCPPVKEHVAGPYPERSPGVGFEVHSLEPSRNLAGLSRRLAIEHFVNASALWTWHPVALSDAPGHVMFDTKWGEGSKLLLDGKHSSLNETAASKVWNTLHHTPGTPEYVRVAVSTVDRFAARHHLDSIDILKIDAEGVDLKVLVGAGLLFEARKVKLVVWEMPVGPFPVSFPSASGVAHQVGSYRELVAFLSAVAGMECYMPLEFGVVLSLRYWHADLQGRGHGRLDRGNMLCVSRQHLPALIVALDRRSLALLSEENLHVLAPTYMVDNQ
mmetsp:Transcript_59322/g.111965  ORF Transcript_59322/g.111965 Transcript_59322/m.111965 type:complete len:404 (-) Transcript_59322:45-1256(-)